MEGVVGKEAQSIRVAIGDAVFSVVSGVKPRRLYLWKVYLSASLTSICMVFVFPGIDWARVLGDDRLPASGAPA